MQQNTRLALWCDRLPLSPIPFFCFGNAAGATIDEVILFAVRN
ncbi:hypothetical protein COO91_05250 [Nostoc flagelliforme CCNUN1]|uniref:Uncharacterized protein n=1 Tax=Nostoc flagelliforme CCNUN1 TaxID=2038116 RepID=A0A2K8SV27_9NOSO|nr:hypothetical protein COO91_05250 [Nostoc flagelliforme CCNUN1]